METETKPCEACGKVITKTYKQQFGRLYWSCGKACSVQLSMKAGKRVAYQANRFSGQKEARPCASCAKPVTRYVTEQNHERAWYCSHLCSGTNLTGKFRPKAGDEIVCRVCGTLFYREPAQLARRDQHFCSDPCARKGSIVGKVEKLCDVCGKIMLVYPIQAEVRRFCSNACSYQSRLKNSAGRMYNGKPVRKIAEGYLLIWEPTHPRNRRGWVPEHRWIMEQKLGRLLAPGEEVDHINSVRDDNDEANLQVLMKADHRKKTGADARQRRLTMAQKLAAYEAKYGPLME